MRITLICINIPLSISENYSMYICICHGVTDSTIKENINNGAHTMKALATELKVGTKCGQCTCCTKKILNTTLMNIAESEPATA